MQDRYVGDIGDFGKYLLLKTLCQNKIKLGVNWCFVNPKNTPKEMNKNDGKYIGYLYQKNKNHAFFKQADENLILQLREIVKPNNRTIASIEKSNILPLGTMFVNEEIPVGTKRFSWHAKSLETFKDCDIIFYDPDNGLEITSCGKLHRYAVKYVFYDEIRDTYSKGKSIIIYQHTNMSKPINEQINVRLNQLDEIGIPKENISVIQSKVGISRFYLIIKQRKKDLIEQGLNNFINNHPLLNKYKA
ncbi:MAG: hypothetical protein K0B10_06780 [Vicingaceae bacterium]|nr:hypothetical protein [Vicingaceae bacterium]